MDDHTNAVGIRAHFSSFQARSFTSDVFSIYTIVFSFELMFLRLFSIFITFSYVIESEACAFMKCFAFFAGSSSTVRIDSGLKSAAINFISFIESLRAVLFWTIILRFRDIFIQ